MNGVPEIRLGHFRSAFDDVTEMFISGDFPFTGTACFGMPPPFSGSGARRVQEMTNSGSPEATPRVNG